MRKTINIKHMTCTHCEAIITQKAIKTGLVIHKISYLDGTCDLEFQTDIQFSQFKIAIEQEGYTVERASQISPLISLFLLIPLAILALLSLNGYSVKLLEGASLGAVFIYGLFSSLHCMSMCGGISLSACQLLGQDKIIKADLYYNTSRVLSYTLIGGFLGWIGTGFDLSGTFKAGILVFSALFMLILGLRQLGIHLIKLPAIPIKNPVLKLVAKAKHPAVVGYLNGFIPCGPLQMAQLFALSAGSMINGMLVMLVFGLGTFPTMFYIGALNSVFTGRGRRIAFKISGVIILLMAVLTFTRAYTFYELDRNLNKIPVSITQIDIKPAAPEAKSNPYALIVDGFQIVHLEANRTYMLESVQVKKDIPVRLVIDAVNLTQCIDTITIPEYGIVKGLSLGENTIEFTPTSEGELIITCWMNMVTQKLTVAE